MKTIKLLKLFLGAFLTEAMFLVQNRFKKSLFIVSWIT